MFRNVFRRLSKRWLVTLVGVVAVSLLVWFVGPLIAVADHTPLEPTLWRGLVILVLFLAWGVNNLRLRSADNKANAALTHNLLASTELKGTAERQLDDAHAAEHALLASRLKDALGKLQQTWLGRGRKLYELPWYVMIGAPGSGKTTAIRNSGLRFPLQSLIGESAVQGSGGTRFCDWWFTDQAVLIDTAGRYTTQDNPRQVDSHAWLGFLKLLKKSRPKRPLNGIIVAVSILDCVKQTPTQQAMQATAIRRRLQELNSHLSMHLPVYVLFTKCDLVAGFNQFFANLDAEDREQAWGITFPLSKPRQVEGVLSVFPRLYTALIARADDRVLTLLQSERDTRRRALAYEFPRQMLSMKDALEGFLKSVFSTNQFEQASLLRGVYFVSGTQIPGAGHWVGGVVPPALCAPPLTAAGHVSPTGFFLKQLFSGVVFQEAQLATANSAAERRFRLRYAASLAVVSVLFLGSVSLWAVGHKKNTAYMEHVHSRVDAYLQKTDGDTHPGQDDWRTLAERLNHLHALAEVPPTEGRLPLKAGLGLSQVQKVEARALKTYQMALEFHFMPKLTGLLLDQVQAASDELDVLFEALRFYLMLFHPKQMQPNDFSLWADTLWQRHLPGDDHQRLRRDLGKHLQAALRAQVPGPPINQERVAAAREALTSMPLEQRLYLRLKRDAMHRHSGEFTVQQVLGSKAADLFSRRSGKPLDQGIPELFTYTHFHALFNRRSSRLAEQVRSEQWIDGDQRREQLSDTELGQLTEQVRDLYFQDYIAHWQDLLDDLELQSFHTVADGHHVLRLLTANEAPLLSLFQAIRIHTALSEPPAALQAAGQVADTLADQALGNQRERLARLVPDAATNAGAADKALPGRQVSDHFRAFNAYAAGGEGMPLQRLQEALEVLNVHVESLAHATNLSEAAFNASRSAGQDGGAVMVLPKALADAPAEVQQWLSGLPSATRQATSVATLAHLNDVWRSDVAPFFRDAIEGRYPVDSDASTDISLEDFTVFFGPGGMLDAYYTAYVMPFVDTSQRQWRWSTPVGMSKRTLRMFERGARIRQAYFNSDGHLRVGFRLKPKSLERVATRSLLETADGQVVYQHGPPRFTSLEWPGETTNPSRLVFNLASQGTPVSTRIDGEWSWFRLLDRHATSEPLPDGNGLLLTFRVNNVLARYELWPGSVHHPFGNDLIRSFSIPEAL